MANYNLVSKSLFNPFTFDELLKPALMATQAHREVEDLLADLNTKASVWEKLADDERDKNSKAYKLYKQYSNELKDLANKLSSEGLSVSSRLDALNMKSRYSSDITPIEEAYLKRALIADELRKLQSSKPYMMFSTDFASEVGIDDMIRNPNLSYTSVSGEDIYNKGLNSAKAASLRRVIHPEAIKALGNLYFELTERQGYSSAEAATFIADLNNIPELKEIISDILNQSGVNNLKGIDKLRAANFAISGVMAGLTYDEEKKYMKNEDYLNPYEQWKWNEEKKGDTPEIPQVPNVNQVFSWEGTEVNKNKNTDIQLMDDDLRNLETYLEESIKGEVPTSYTEERYINKALDKVHRDWIKERDKLLGQNIPIEYIESNTYKFPTYAMLKAERDRLVEYEKLQASMNLRPNGITKKVEVKNPLYESYDKLSKKYGSEDINFLINKQKEEIIKKASNNRIAYMNTNTSELGSRHINTSLFSGIDLDDKDQLGKMIHKKGDIKDVPSKGELTDIISKNTKYGIDPINKKMYAFTPGKGTYEINAAAILNTLNIITSKGMMTGYEYLKEVSNRAVQGKPWEGKSNYTNAMYNEELTHLFNALIARANSGAPETSSTNSDMSTYYTNSDLMKIAKEIKKQNK